MQHHGMNVAETGSRNDHPQAVDDGERRRFPAFHVEAHHRPEQSFLQQSGRGLAVGVAVRRGEAQFFDRGAPFQPCGRFQRVAALLAHAQRQRFHAAHDEIRGERAEIAAERTMQRFRGLAMFASGQEKPAERVAVPGQIFRRAVDDHVRAQLQRPQEQRSGERGIHDQQSAAAAGDFRNLVDRGHAHQGIGNGLDVDCRGARLGRYGVEPLQIANVAERRFDAGRRKHAGQNAERRAVKHVGGDNGLAAIGQGGQQRQMDRGHAR